MLISSTVSSTTDRQRDGTIAAPDQQAAAVGLSKPLRKLPLGQRQSIETIKMVH